MKKSKIELLIIMMLCIAVLFSYSALGAKVANAEVPAQNKYIKWMTFNIPYSALCKSMNIDIKTSAAPCHINWIEVLSYLSAKYGGNWKKYSSKDMDTLVQKLKSGEKIETLTKGMKYYSYFYKSYSAVLSGFLGNQKTVGTDGKVQGKYGMTAYSPIARGFGYSHYDDFGDSRSFGFSRPHLGNDLIGSVGTPVVSVEGGYVEALGWNRYGGWRIGIRSFDRKRYYYYAHLRSNHPYANNLRQGQLVRAGEVIGYLGMTGYSNKENANNMTVPHLHFGIQIIFDESQKDGTNQIWINVYDIVNLLSNNKIPVKKDSETKEYYSCMNFHQ